MIGLGENAARHALLGEDLAPARRGAGGIVEFFGREIAAADDEKNTAAKLLHILADPLDRAHLAAGAGEDRAQVLDNPSRRAAPVERARPEAAQELGIDGAAPVVMLQDGARAPFLRADPGIEQDDARDALVAPRQFGDRR